MSSVSGSVSAHVNFAFRSHGASIYNKDLKDGANKEGQIVYMSARRALRRMLFFYIACQGHIHQGSSMGIQCHGVLDGAYAKDSR